MWARCEHTFAPLTHITSSKVEFKWTKIEQYAFGVIIQIVDHNTLLVYPYFNEEFKIRTNGSTSN